MTNQQNHIIIIGGGFAGIRAGLQIRKRLRHHSTKITLIDKNAYQLFTPSLYEVATSEEPQRNIAIPLKKIFDNNLQLLQNQVEKIDPRNNTIMLKDNETIKYDYLIIAAGSQPAFMEIPGLEKFATGFKTLKDALEIKNKIKNLCCKDGKCNKKTKVVIGGGGFAGTELAAELLTYKNKIAIQNHLDKDCLDLTIIQGSNKLLKELDEHVSNLAEKRLHSPNVHFAFGGHIKSVTKTEVHTDNDKIYPYEILIWTGGVEPNHLAKTNNLPVNKRGGILVNDYLQVEGFPNIFAAGDIAGYIDPKTQQPAHNVAQVAEDQGKIVGENVARQIMKQSLMPYHYTHWGYVVPLRGYFAVAELIHGIHFDGFPGWVLQQLVFLRYLYGILSLPRALQRFNTFELEMKK